jgi:hypothetical protein
VRKITLLLLNKKNIKKLTLHQLFFVVGYALDNVFFNKERTFLVHVNSQCRASWISRPRHIQELQGNLAGSYSVRKVNVLFETL